MMWRNIIFVIFQLSFFAGANNIIRDFRNLVVKIGNNIGEHVQNRIQNHLRKVEYIQRLHFANSNDKLQDILQSLELRDEYLLLIKLGNCETEYVNKVAESYTIELHQKFSSEFNLTIYELTSNGAPLSTHKHRNISFDIHHIHYGALVGAYATLELLGFAFLHPLEPYIPSHIQLKYPSLYTYTNATIYDSNENQTIESNNNNNKNNNNNNNKKNIDNHRQLLRQPIFTIYDQPYWPERGFHLHTQHPLELTEVLQGHDIPHFGPLGPHCQQYNKRHYSHGKNHSSTSSSSSSSSSFTDYPKEYPYTIYCERWEEMIIDVDYFFEWSIANKLNKIEWLLLGNFKWAQELQSSSRQVRLSKLTKLGHQYSLLIGAVVPIGNIQQHGWHMVNVRLPIEKQYQQIYQRVDWLFTAQFDFLTTESGLSEFTHPECDLMLDLLNAFAIYVNGTWGREAAVKVHCSTGQRCEDFIDPQTGSLLNFNFLPTYAHSSLGVFPHTVQMYGFHDSIGGAYGNDNFSYVEDYLIYEAKKGKRSVLFYGETAYWVNVDIDVPLFLPIYGHRRLQDLYQIAIREQQEDFRIDGQMNFDSGWEWGYWLHDVITARASWNPFLGRLQHHHHQQPSSSSSSSTRAVEKIVENDIVSYIAYGESLNIFTHHLYGEKFGQRLQQILVELTQAQSKILIQGQINGRPSPNIKKLTGIAYLCGTDTWMELPRMLKLHLTQANKVGLRETDDPDWPYALEITEEMEMIFHQFSENIDQLYNDILNYYTIQQQQEESSLSIAAKSCSTPTDDSSTTFTEVTFCGADNTATQVTINSQISSLYINQQALNLLEEITDSIRLLWLRAKQVKVLYESKQAQIMKIEAISSGESTLRFNLLIQGRNIIQEAMKIIQRREKHYRVHWERIAAWRDNPTVYRFTYLWAVHSLYYWWRDQGLAEESPYFTPHSPCYLNRMDSTEVAVGWGKYTIEFVRNFIHKYTPFASWYPLEIVNCLSSPSYEYEFPRDLHVVRPLKR
jgi:hypothetical protein